MPLEAYKRGKTWWAKGRVDYNDRPITDYIRESTGSPSEAGAWDWIEDREDQERRRYLVGEERELMFSEAVVLYPANPEMAKHLIPILAEFGEIPVKDISPKMVRDLGPKLYPNNCTDSWLRAVVKPTRAVINNAHDMGKCAPIRIKGYDNATRVRQDRLRGKDSRVERKPGDWNWLLRFRETASPKLGALAFLMFATGARIGQAVAMDPDKHLDLQRAQVCIPAAKGHADRWLTVPMELVVELANLPRMTPRGWSRRKGNYRVFGYADRCTPLKAWKHACKKAGIEYLSPHAAGRHGFGQEHNVRQGTDEKAAGKFGGWSDTALMKRTYTHSEGVEGKIHEAFRTGLVQAENETGLKLLKAG